MTTNLEVSRRYYEEGLGLEPNRIGETSVSYCTGACELKLQADFDPDVLATYNMDSPTEPRGSGSVYVIETDSTLEALHERISEDVPDRVGETLIEPTEVPWGKRMFLTRDPNGYVFEIREPSSDGENGGT